VQRSVLDKTDSVPLAINYNIYNCKTGEALEMLIRRGKPYFLKMFRSFQKIKRFVHSVGLTDLLFLRLNYF